MSKSLSERINIFLTVSLLGIEEHFNPNDPAPIYKRQLSHEFEQYILISVAAAKRDSILQYKVTCKKENDKQYTEPLIYAIKRHFMAKKYAQEAAFARFKKRSFRLLFSSLAVVVVCHGLVPLFLTDNGGLYSALLNGIDIFSWVMLWQPIDKLLFHWNPYLKDIAISRKLATAEVIISENVKPADPAATEIINKIRTPQLQTS
jgi:hypothetical protein